MAAATQPVVETFIGGVPIEHHKGNIPTGTVIQEVVQATLAANVVNTFTLSKSYTELLHATVMFGTSNAGTDLFLEPPYFTLSGATLTLTFKTHTPEAEAATVIAWVR